MCGLRHDVTTETGRLLRLLFLRLRSVSARAGLEAMLRAAALMMRSTGLVTAYAVRGCLFLYPLASNTGKEPQSEG